METAANLSFNTKYTGTISQTNEKSFYKINLATSGSIEIKSKANMKWLYYQIYDENGVLVWEQNPMWNSGSGLISVEYDVDLTSGIYYLALRRDGSNIGNYELNVTYANSEESFSEKQGGSNNMIAQANKISCETTYKGQIAKNDEKDFYKFDLATSGTCTLNLQANMEYLYCNIYDENGVELWNSNPRWNSNLEQINLEEAVVLTSGTYYIGIIRDSGRTGNYSFSINFASANESFKEINKGSNNTMNAANAIRLNTTYLGQIALNDSKDFYKFSLAADDTVHLYAESYMPWVYYRVFKPNGEQICSENVRWNDNSQQGILNKDIILSAGEYYLQVEKDGRNAGNYSFKLSASKVVNVDKVTGVKVGGRASNALRLNWNKNSQADGYIIEQYKGNQWTRIAKISGNATTTYRVENLSASNSYKFRVQAYKFSGGTPFYSEYTYIEGKTNPSDISGLKIGGHAKDALRLNWNRNTSASGYIIEVYKSGSWNRVARISNNTTVTYRVEKLSSNTKYSFRVKAFGFDGSTALYGNEATVSGTTDADGTTKPTNVSGFKIGGRASNALRLNWNKNADASGYIIEQYTNGTWNRIARIGNGSTTTYRVENLKAGTNYQFRIKAFGFKGAEAVYGKYVSISGKTNPAAVTGMKIGGTAKDALRLNWNTASGAEGYIIERYESNTWKRIARLEGGKTATYRVEGLKAGTSYRFRMKAFGFDGSTAIYSEYKEVTGKTDAAAPAVTIGTMTGVKIGGRADNALRLNWNKNASAAGYIIEQNQNGTWSRIARIGQNNTTTYRVEKLSAGRTYQFRIQGFGFQGSTPVYGNFTYVNGTTIPSKVSGLCIGGTATDALRLNWNKNTNASGYIIEKLQNGAWVRVARIADKNTQTYRVEGLQSKTSYVFRICAFGFDGGTALYSDYQMIDGNTR